MRLEFDFKRNCKPLLFFLCFISAPLIILFITFHCKKLDAQGGSLLINAYSILAGVFYFFKRLDFDKTCLLIKNRRERLDQLKSELNNYNNLVKIFLKKDFTNDEAFSFHKNNILFSGATINTLLDICEKSGDIDSVDAKKIIRVSSFVENDPSFTGNRDQLQGMNAAVYQMNYGYNFGPARDTLHALIVDTDKKHLGI